MGMFRPTKPRRFNHRCIYYNERKERLDQMEEKARRELGLLPEKEFNPEDIRGKFVEGTTHLKRRKQSKRKPLHIGIMLILVAILLFLWHYLHTGNWAF